MGGKTGAFSNSLMLVVRRHGLVGFLEVAVKDALVAFGDGLPKLFTGSLTWPANDTGDHLPSLLK